MKSENAYHQDMKNHNRVGRNCIATANFFEIIWILRENLKATLMYINVIQNPGINATSLQCCNLLRRIVDVLSINTYLSIREYNWPLVVVLWLSNIWSSIDFIIWQTCSSDDNLVYSDIWQVWVCRLHSPEHECILQKNKGIMNADYCSLTLILLLATVRTIQKSNNIGW